MILCCRICWEKYYCPSDGVLENIIWTLLSPRLWLIQLLQLQVVGQPDIVLYLSSFHHWNYIIIHDVYPTCRTFFMLAAFRFISHEKRISKWKFLIALEHNTNLEICSLDLDLWLLSHYCCLILHGNGCSNLSGILTAQCYKHRSSLNIIGISWQSSIMRSNKVGTR